MYTRFISILLLALFLAIPAASFAKSKPNITCELTATKRVVAPGESTTISWKAGGTILSYGPDGKSIPPWGSIIVTPDKRTIYKFKFVGLGGNEKCGIRIRVAGETLPQ